MRTINIQDAKTHLSRLVEAIETGAEDEIVIARNGRPVARLVATRSVPTDRRIGVARGLFTVPETIDADESAIAVLFGQISG
jgi:prevent-host-death family protein